MSEKVRLIFRPEVPPPLGYIPQIDMTHPLRPSERLLPDIIVDKDENGVDAFFFDLDQMVARHILERDVCYQLWAPAELKIVVRDNKGAHMVTARSVNPAIHRVPKVLQVVTPEIPKPLQPVVPDPPKEKEAETPPEPPVVVQIVPPVSPKEAAEKIKAAAKG